jgi:hypothetical protein
MITAYREPDRHKGRKLMSTLRESVSHGVPRALTEVITLGRSLNNRAADVLVRDLGGTAEVLTTVETFTGRPRTHTSNGSPTTRRILRRRQRLNRRQRRPITNADHRSRGNSLPTPPRQAGPSGHNAAGRPADAAHPRPGR